ncbi:PR domain zinc finger protein 1-like [Galleria mellonella]|uniref:PR domain zinc finger protein 1-like n=1 Tax=Galleria mellonella TaxID=7137 RepID=A0ABM3MAA3_GALME|nr:PR domain zinc finger protein 1-like [Galleria mellonella]
MERHILFLTSVEEPVQSENSIPAQDPLNGIGIQGNNCYRLNNSIIFAEPLNYSKQIKEENTDGQMTTFIDNVIVQKTPGKRNKYHMYIEDLSNPTCPQQNCNKTFSNMTLLKAHIRKIHCADRNRYICDQCGSGFPAVYLLRRHTAVHAGERVQCPVCKKSLSARTNLSTHLRSHADTRTHECGVCHKRFVRKCTLNAHVKFVHRVGELNCDKCDDTFTSRIELRRHVLTHNASPEAS